LDTIVENIKNIKTLLPSEIKLIAVSKTVTAENILKVYNSGHKIFGENKVQELVQKHSLLPKDIEWHFIGHLQTNKIKFIAPFIHMIHSVDSLKLLKVINNEAKKVNRVIKCLLQVHIAQEETKFGFAFNEVEDLLKNLKIENFPFIEISGLMGMATYTDDIDIVHSEFRSLKNCFELLKNKHFVNCKKFKEISMGMSGDYQIAIQEGSTILRLGSIIFGERNYL